MGAVMNGMALHGGVIPYGGTFLTFTDYCRPAIRLSALMALRVIYVMTHDSIGLGEDGPTHQPVEHLASLRALPNLLLFRPADAVETAECWALALANAARPSVLALTRQGVPCLRAEGGDDSGNACARGGYVLREASARTPRVVLLATGSECAIADEGAADAGSRRRAHPAGVAPCWALFRRTGARLSRKAPGRRRQRANRGRRPQAPSAGSAMWGRPAPSSDLKGFGASAPARDLYAHFGITAEAVVAAAKARL